MIACVTVLGAGATSAGATQRPQPAGSGADCRLPESDADALAILNTYYPNRYVWDETDLTVAVQAAPNVSDVHVTAVGDAIGAWDGVLRQCFGGQITLTEVTAGQRRSADIVLHYVPHAGGAVFAGYAICGANSCGNIIMSSEFGAPTNEGYTPEYLYYVTLHEVGHALGLGHATNLWESTDLMGYGWLGGAPNPEFSQCDLDAIAYLFGPALAGDDPADPGLSALDSSFDCAAG